MNTLTVKDLRNVLEQLCSEGKEDIPITSFSNNHFTAPCDRTYVGLVEHRYISGNKISLMIGNIIPKQGDLQRGNAEVMKILK